MKVLTMILLLSAATLAQAEEPTEQPLSGPEQMGQAVDNVHANQPLVPKHRSVGSSAGLVCEPGYKLIGDDCHPIATFE
ncbi:hypothetical protein RTH46_25320 [Pseudomonas sp. zfem004]|uniref:hypothetical protein n=1 Tax=unclassified Pseudomonas TaxID=196821 RepID=UPI00129A0C2B|nr:MULTISPECIES: hypothetical protein [unclassified Pseudomonas]MDU9405805.1 hypothetical protein [Pseudomonas sp. zfem004]